MVSIPVSIVQEIFPANHPEPFQIVLPSRNDHLRRFSILDCFWNPPGTGQEFHGPSTLRFPPETVWMGIPNRTEESYAHGNGSKLISIRDMDSNPVAFLTLVLGIHRPSLHIGRGERYRRKTYARDRLAVQSFHEP